MHTLFDESYFFNLSKKNAANEFFYNNYKDAVLFNV